MHAFPRILACALPFLILKLHIAAAAASAFEPGSVVKGNAVISRDPVIPTSSYETDTTLLQAREIRNPDYSSSSPQDATARNTTTTPAREITEEDSLDHGSNIDNDEHAQGGAHSADGVRNVLFSRAAGKFQVKQLRQRSAELDSGAVMKSTSRPNSNADLPSKRGSPVVFVPRPIPTADRPQGGNRVVSGFNPPERTFEDFGSVNHRSFEDSAANRTSDHHPSPLEFQVSDHIRHVEE
ncbi:hypothetical protein BDN71DRAFT_1509923 [Pleurotus eryngii]|uniref:Uncharacterized protein n=1 Tax=Pleurotus eryngii TaxID=5323 RepID=A0A9P5ZQ44_PLEER|nr:hypothetical protein BDN71DRAFT_1509923 [Pleurotus eryngii]